MLLSRYVTLTPHGYFHQFMLFHKLIWNNLNIIAQSYNLLWLMVGDFNKVLSNRPRFTWSNLRLASQLIQERVDMVFANSNWCLVFKDATVTHLHMTKSDHRLVLIKFCDKPFCNWNKPFRFQKMWLDQPKFNQILAQVWHSSNLNLPNTLKVLATKLTSWNQEYQLIPKYEEDLWAMKSKVNWLIDKDRKARFFHLTTTKRRSFNRIDGINNSERA
ncbi:reverse transcriptase [Gossypium australe]|uniref:Reverse transcriptase n=1 Tax=Gossypium australe TaxID=47621 RepID=A0A5B6X0T9_9ROSI|nr:reverse transcriptase [Gossypium australe]